KAVALIRAAAAAKEWELCRHDAGDPEFEIGTLLDDLTGGALFANARLIVMQRVSALFAKSGPKAAPALSNALKARLVSGVEGCVIIAVDNLRADNQVAKAVVAADGIVVGCRRLWETPPPWDLDPRKSELVQWFSGLARAKKVSLTPDEAAYVCAATGNDLYALESQLPRLAERGASAVIGTVDWQAGGSPWEIAEKLVQGDASRAVAGIEALFSAGFQGKDGMKTLDRGGLLAMFCGALNGKTREALIAAEALQAGAGGKEASALAGVRGAPAKVSQFEQRVRSRSTGEWREMLVEIGELERKSRSGATVDQTDLAHLALRFRKVPRRQ
ncbi:MAG: DNA polymerase III delta subunit, partial [Planctomycetota bacterium]